MNTSIEALHPFWSADLDSWLSGADAKEPIGLRSQDTIYVSLPKVETWMFCQILLEWYKETNSE